MDLAKRAKAIQAILTALSHIVPSGGGDFSTAKLTVSGGVLHASLPYLMDMGGFVGLFTSIMSYKEGSYDIALWKGSAIIEIQDEATVSGDIEDMGGGAYLITGDCTITIS